MSDMFRCDDKEALVAYLYGESEVGLTRDIERHLHSCTACSEEVASLKGVRRELETWVPSMPDLGFTVVRQPVAAPAPVLRSPRWSSVRSLPAWAQAAAAVLVIGAGAAIANVQVRYGSEGLLVTTGWMSPAPATTRLADPVAAPAREDWRPALVALEQSLRSEMAQIKRTPDASAVSARNADAVDSAAMMRRVQSMLDASERRQREDASLMLTQFTRDVELQRRADLMRINQTFGALQGRTFKNEAGQAEMMNLLRRVSAQPIP